MPLRLVHACLQVTEQVWQPMHLSRFITMLIWAMRACQYSPGPVRLRIIVTSSRLLPVGPM